MGFVLNYNASLCALHLTRISHSISGSKNSMIGKMSILLVDKAFIKVGFAKNVVQH